MIKKMITVEPNPLTIENRQMSTGAFGAPDMSSADHAFGAKIAWQPNRRTGGKWPRAMGQDIGRGD